MYNFITTKLQGHKEIELFKVKMRYGIKKTYGFRSRNFSVKDAFRSGWLTKEIIGEIEQINTWASMVSLKIHTHQ